jgi:hypothetical protein
LGLNEHRQDTCDNCEKGNTLDQGSCQDHVGTNVVHCFRLTGNRFNRTTTDLADTDTGTNGS